MQILHPFVGSPQQYAEHILDPDRDRLQHCPLCQAREPLWAHGFYCRTLVEMGWEGAIRVRRFLCRVCRRTISLLPQFALPYLRFSVVVICQFLSARLLQGRTLVAAALTAGQAGMPYQRGQFWVRRFCRQAEALAAALADRVPAPPAADFVTRALQKIQARGAIASHRFLLGQLRMHLLGWPLSLAPAGGRVSLPPGEVIP
jgi:hypothetical protein